MVRTVIGAGAGAAVGMLVLAAVGGWYGFENGVETARVPPGVDAAVRSALIWCVFFFWIAIPAGAVVGGAAGFGSWLVSPNSDTAPRGPERWPG